MLVSVLSALFSPLCVCMAAYRQDTPWALCVDDKRLQSTLVYHYRNTLYSNPGICSQYTVIQVTVTQVLLERQCWHCMSAVNMHTARCENCTCVPQAAAVD